MANPNIVNVTTIYGRTIAASLSTSNLAYLTGTAGYVKKINSITAANTDGINDADVTVLLTLDGSQKVLAWQITVPAKSTLVILSKDTAVYIEENDEIRAYASATGDLDIIISYEEIA